MKKNLFFITISLILSFSSAWAATLHAILVGDTKSDLRVEVEKSLRTIERVADVTAKQMHVAKHVVVLKGRKAHPARIMQTISALHVAPDDYILFYFEGHGFRRQEKTSSWPYLYFVAPAEELDLDLIVHSLKQKNARKSVVIADCCNVVRLESAYNFPVPCIDLEYFASLPLKYDQSHLFQESGLWVFTASSPGEPAWTIPRGSVFTVALLQESRTPSFDFHWREVLQATRGIENPVLTRVQTG